ncbi:MAG: universal stress protein [Bacteroidales bacterium]|jgi:nucleotide-binding universal stress UspA family protein|nr:universal stress protein [Bacteroidales bacterium]MCK9448328.1 universal stress protein [Bacteroidales bacterium]MDD3701669.1 universal stress protein [Bacteroidales bacterium]MDY0369934.1 universal stress protein [Bacteroidales bacterium]
MKILLATDFSEENQMLFPYAIDLIRATGGKIMLFHAYMDQIVLGDMNFPDGFSADTYFNRELRTEMKKQATEHMNEKQQQLQQLLTQNNIPNVVIEPVLKGGSPEFELLELTETEKPDLILMGTKGKGRKAFLEGSIAKSLMSKVNVPLLAIPENYTWRTNNDILYATNFGKFEISTIHQLIELTKKHHPIIHIVHLLFDPKDQRAGLLMNELEQAFAAAKDTKRLRFHLVEAKHAATALQEFTENHAISLAAFIANKRSWLHYIFKDKVGKEDFFQLGIPLLAFKCPDS